MRNLSPIQLQQQIIHYKSEMEKYKQKCLSLEDNFLSQKFNSLKKENQHLQSHLESFKQQLESKESEQTRESAKHLSLLHAQDKEIKKLRHANNQLKDRQRLLHHSNKLSEHLLLKISSLEKEIIESQETNSYLLKENERLVETIQKVEKCLYEIEIQSGEMDDIMSVMIKECLAQKQLFLTERSWEHYKNDQLQNENESLKTLLYSREVQLFEAQEALTESKLHYEEVIKDHIKRLEEAHVGQLKKESCIQKLNSKLKKSQDDKSLYFDTLQTIRMNIKQMKKSFVSDTDESIISIDSLKKYENSIYHLQFTNAILIEEINKLKNKPGLW